MTARPNYGAMADVARANRQVLRHCGTPAEIPATGAQFQAWIKRGESHPLRQSLDTLIVPDEIAQEIQAGTVIRLQSCQHDFIASGPPEFDYGTQPVAVAQVNNYASVWRSAAGPRDGIGRPQANLVAVVQEIPVICKGTEKFYVSPDADIRQGDLIQIDSEKFLVVGIGMRNQLHLTMLRVAKQSYGSQDDL